MVDNKNCCKNCEHYSQHYVKDSGEFNKINCGGCTSKNNKMGKKKPSDLCDYGEDINIKIEEDKKSVPELLKSTLKHLNKIVDILQKDEK